MQSSVDDRGGWTRINSIGNGDDACSGAIPLGFTYNGFGASTSQVTVSTNGVLFLGTSCSSAAGNTTLPASISNDPMLFFFWDDLRDFGSGELIDYNTSGSPGGRVFNLYFQYRMFNTCGSNTVRVMLSVHEASGLVKATYTDPAACSQLKGGTATFGFQGAGGTSAQHLQVSVNSEVLDDNMATQTMSFHPPN